MPSMEHVNGLLHTAMSSVVGISMARLVLAAILGGLIGLEREHKHRPAGLRTNLFICMGSAMFTILSDALAGEHTGDHTRIAAQIIPGIGFIGAGSILHSRNNLVTGLTTASTIFVVASVGMAVGGGLYFTSMFMTGLILLCLYLLGRMEEVFNLKVSPHTYEVTGRTEDDVTAEVNRILEFMHGLMENIQTAQTKQHVRVQFEVAGTRREQNKLLHSLQQSEILESVTPLGQVQTE